MGNEIQPTDQACDEILEAFEQRYHAMVVTPGLYLGFSGQHKMCVTVY